MRKCKQYADVYLLQASRNFSKAFNSTELSFQRRLTPSQRSSPSGKRASAEHGKRPVRLLQDSGDREQRVPQAPPQPALQQGQAHVPLAATGRLERVRVAHGHRVP